MPLLKGNRLRIDIQCDSGGGMPKQFLNHLYPFTLLMKERGESMTEGVPSNLLRYTVLPRCRLDSISHDFGQRNGLFATPISRAIRVGANT
jgi:hypothetical protein